MAELITCARRAINLQTENDRVIAWLEDDFHHFGIEMSHDGERVTAVNGIASRYPRDTCPGAVGVLQEAVGVPLQARSTALGEHTNMRMHCTHMYDLLSLAIAHAAQGRLHRRYDAMVPDRVSASGASDEPAMMGSTAPQIYCDGKLVMAWQVQGNDITGPDQYKGISMGRGFREWTDSLDLDRAEAALVLRRAVMIALGRMVDMQSLSPENLQATAGLCHSFQPEVVKNSSPTIASSRDYSDNPEGLLADIEC
ncbi:MAG: hypothetical protein ACI9JM_003424 [Halioglobus sp.]|jgi:hypothetical protein